MDVHGVHGVHGPIPNVSVETTAIPSVPMAASCLWHWLHIFIVAHLG
jgi:hypothetical protein